MSLRYTDLSVVAKKIHENTYKLSGLLLCSIITSLSLLVTIDSLSTNNSYILLTRSKQNGRMSPDVTSSNNTGGRK